MTIQDVARHHLQQRFAKPKLRNLKRIAINEIDIGGRSGYLTNVTNVHNAPVSKLRKARMRRLSYPFGND
uniref:Uncharacterized protein n=1 Tax=Candidatus Kentrum sp. TC TaxID=2126339 RepID=A0A450ZCI1_9GAMM|nr:MAG: hypothetical protein BECKTC1821F_GA0114240_1001117 [Candidatus Kentron sp. TC]